MRWRTFFASVGLSWLAVGCQPDVTLGQSPYAQINPPVADPAMNRAQKPEGDAARPPAPPQSPITRVSAPSKPDVSPATPENVQSLLDIPLVRTDNGKPGLAEPRIRATVNGQPIFEDEIRDAILPSIIRIARDPSLSETERNRERAKVYNAALQEIINRELLLWDATEKFKKQPKTIEKLKESASREFERSMRERRRAAGIKSDEELKKELQREGLSLELMRRQYERNFLAKSYLSFMIGDKLDKVNHEEIQEYYEKHPEEFQGEDRVDWQDLFLLNEKYGSPQATRVAAIQIRDRLRAGESFENFVQYDDGESKLNNGQGSGHRRGEIRPQEVEAALFQMKEGEVGELIEIGTGIHVVRLVHREYAGMKPFYDEKVQSAIKDKLRNELGNREMQRALQDLKRRSQIEVSHLQ